jgi:hypothetical protein
MTSFVRFIFTLIIGFGVGPSSASTEGETPEAILRAVDAVRQPLGTSFAARLVITPYRSGVAKEPGTYAVRASEGRVLVEALNPDQRGQKFLSTEKGLFFYAPRTRRAMRITPLQSLRGQASIGDISRISLTNDYSISSSERHKCPEDETCVRMSLLSKSENSTYARIQLVVMREKTRWLPISAELYLISGKLSKIVTFEKPAAGLPPTARYTDAITTAQASTVEYVEVKPASFDISLFNPRTLEQ